MEHIEKKKKEKKEQPFDKFHGKFKTEHELIKLRLGRIKSRLESVEPILKSQTELDISDADKNSLKVMEKFADTLSVFEDILNRPDDEVEPKIKASINNKFSRMSILFSSPSVGLTEPLKQLHEQLSTDFGAILEKFRPKEKSEEGAQ